MLKRWVTVFFDKRRRADPVFHAFYLCLSQYARRARYQFFSVFLGAVKRTDICTAANV